MPRKRVLLEDSDADVAAKLRAAPGHWFVIAVGEKNRLGVIATIGSRINQNKHRAFCFDTKGWYEAVVRSNQARWNQKAPVEMHARWMMRTWENPGPDR